MAVYVDADGDILTDQYWVCNCGDKSYHNISELQCQKCKRKHEDSFDAPVFGVLEENFRVKCLNYL